jgi:hypothetical protein
MSSSTGQQAFIYSLSVPQLVVNLDAEKLAKKVSERLGTFEYKNISERNYGEPEFRNMRWMNPRSIM